MTITVNTLSSVATSHDPLQNGDLFAVERAGTMGKTTWAEVQTQDFAASGDWTFSAAATFTGTVDLTSSTLSGIYSRSAATATTSGTSFNFSSIPSWANEVIVNFRNVSLSGTDTILIQLGDSGGIETTAYECVHGYITTAASITRNNNTAGVAIGPLSGGDGLYGSVTFTNYGGNTWNASGQLVDNGNEYHFTAGSKTLSDVLTQLTVTRSGSSTFDAGGISVAWRR